jgi:hypothetical protein
MAYVFARHGDLRSVEERHAIAAAELKKLGGKAIYPVGEEACDVMAAEIERIEKIDQPPPTDPAYRAAWDEFRNHVDGYRHLYASICVQQKRLRARPPSEERAILNEITPDLLVEPVSTQGMIDGAFGRQPREISGHETPGKLYPPDFPSTLACREGTRRAIAATHNIQALADRLSQVSEFDNSAPEDRNRRLILALFSRILALEQQLSQPKRRRSA